MAPYSWSMAGIGWRLMAWFEPFRSGPISLSSAVLCEILGALCGILTVLDETAEDKTKGTQSNSERN